MQKRKRYMFPYIHGETQLYSVVFGMISYSVSPKALVGGAVLTVNTWPETFTRTVCMRRPVSSDVGLYDQIQNSRPFARFYQTFPNTTRQEVSKSQT